MLVVLFFLACFYSYGQDTLSYPSPPPVSPPPIPIERFNPPAPSQPILIHPACDSTANEYQRRLCGNEKITSFIQEKLIYPQDAKLQNISGTTVVYFIINEDGYIQEESIQLKRDIGGGCGEEALRLVYLLQKQRWQWHPAQLRNKPVKIMFAMPIKFRL